jgi:CRISPR-associated protein Cmr4
MNNYLTYLHLLTPLHTGASVDEGNLMGVAREVHTEFPHLPASSVRGKIRSQVESQFKGNNEEAAAKFFGQKIKNGQQPSEGFVWFGDASLLFFPVASLSHHLVWVTCPLWLERWQRWYPGTVQLDGFLSTMAQQLQSHEAIASFQTSELYLQTAVVRSSKLKIMDNNEKQALQPIIATLKSQSSLLARLPDKLVLLDEESCLSLVEVGLQREVRVALEEDSKLVKGGSFRSEEAIPPETILFVPWGVKPIDNNSDVKPISQATYQMLSNRLQFGGLESLGRGWANLKTINSKQESQS